jgi:hypothetical protein
VCVSSCRLVGRCHATPGTYTLLDPNPYVCVRTNVRKYMVKLCVNTLSTIIKHHGRKSSNTMVKHHQQPWSNIIKHHGRQSSSTMVEHRQKPWSQSFQCYLLEAFDCLSACLFLYVEPFWARRFQFVLGKFYLAYRAYMVVGCSGLSCCILISFSPRSHLTLIAHSSRTHLTLFSLCLHSFIIITSLSIHDHHILSSLLSHSHRYSASLLYHSLSYHTRFTFIPLSSHSRPTNAAH